MGREPSVPRDRHESSVAIGQSKYYPIAERLVFGAFAASQMREKVPVARKKVGKATANLVASARIGRERPSKEAEKTRPFDTTESCGSARDRT